MTREEFLNEARRAAEASSAKSKLPADVTVAQAALESRWGESILSREANNYFGIKAHGSHEAYEIETREVVNGREITVTARFAKYADMQECFEDRDRMITTSAIYAGAKAAVGDVERFVRELAKHWATDPKYAEKLLRMCQQVEAVKQ